jgi:hypothetical protein
VRDFHSFRVTWVTLALTAGVPLELVQEVTGHKTTDIVLKHYFQPGREDLRQTLESAKPLLQTLPIDGLEITNAAGVITLRLHTTDSPPDGTMLRACAPQNSGCRRGIGYRLLGTLDSPVNNYITITTAYTNRFGVPTVGDRVFVSVNANVNGYEGIPLVFSARVPVAA